MHKRIKTKKVKLLKNVTIIIIIMITLYYDSNKKGKEFKVATKRTLKIKKNTFA